jgi:thioredoxin 1
MNMNTETRETFSDVINGDKPVLVDFHAEWCGPCKMMKPILQELRQAMGEKIRIIKIDIDRNRPIAESLNISGVPTLILYQKGKMLWRQSGVVDTKQLKNIITQKVTV